MSFTVSATQVNTAINDPHQLTVVILTGTSATPLGATLSQRTTGVGCSEASLAGLTNNSWVMGEVVDDLLATAWAADAQTTIENNYTTGGLRCVSFRPAAATSATPTTFGFTGSVAGDGAPLAFAEFLASGTIAKD